MSLPIITTLRRCYDLQRTVLDTAVQLAHRASIYGVVRVSLRFLAGKCRCCKQTVVNHLKQLIACKILAKQRQRKKGRLYFDINTYRFLIPWRTAESSNGPSQKSRPNLPPPERGEDHATHDAGEKFGTIRGDIAAHQRGLRYCTPGSLAYEATQATIATLTAFLDLPPGGAGTGTDH